MKRNSLFFFLISLFSLSNVGVSAQISHGGKPFFLQTPPPQPSEGEAAGSVIEYSATAKSPSGDLGVTLHLPDGGAGDFEMPAFDLDSVLREDQLNERNMQRSYRFAHKFYTKIEKRKDAALTVLPDGTKVWQIHIRSKGAYSINILLTDFELPQGGKLFVYNEDHSHVIGSFDYRNNSPEKILPIQPVAGESITIEYSEPADVPFEGNFTVSEVSHDYRDFLRREPGNDGGSIFSCMPDALCSGIDENLIRSTVLLVIDGSVACSGVLVNNTENDGTPYILTAVHCLNNELEDGIYKDTDYYITHSGTIVTFFNYNRPVCGSRLKGTEELTMAETYPRAILEKRDVALLELREKPPVYYNAYYAGWNMEENGNTGMYTNLHHPSAAIKKYGKAEANLSAVSFQAPKVFEYESHWEVPGWTTGSTYGGSSGSPLFDKNGLVVGTLSGGVSNCNNSSPNGGSDYFTILYKSWKTSDANNQLKTYLDPNDKGLKQLAGMDPNEENPLFRLSNMNFSAGDVLEVKALESPNSGFAYGSSNLETKEFAEEFTTGNAVEVFGTYLFVPPLPSNGVTGVEISIYSGTTSPEKLLQTQNFSPQYLDYSSSTGFNPKDKNMISFGTESFVLFDEPVPIAKGKFYISYKINVPASFCVYNAKFNSTGSSTRRNTAWVKDPLQGWIQATVYSPVLATKTSLAIQPLVRSIKMDSLPDIPGEEEYPLFFDSKNHTLFLREPASEPVEAFIYSLTGALMEKVQFNKGERSVPLAEKTRGTIGIVQLLLPNKPYSKKIIY
ncbi:MAG: trypsin-like peptidase domain-containing protein [Dysgonamonadaceae bacterium]|jgi:hypothetical protein|nr:trypsin-like peptidase domain-containing protein [Dysgonamonadaceae bacterium]